MFGRTFTVASQIWLRPLNFAAPYMNDRFSRRATALKSLLKQQSRRRKSAQRRNRIHGLGSLQRHAVRALLSSRKAVQRKCIDLANEIRGLFRIFGLRLPSRINQACFDEQVRPIIEADPDLTHALLPLLDARAVLVTTYRELDR